MIHVQLRDALRKLEALAGMGKATQLKAIVEKEAIAAEGSNRIFATRLQMLRSSMLPTVSIKMFHEHADVTQCSCSLRGHSVYRHGLHGDGPRSWMTRQHLHLLQDPKLEGEQREVVISRKEVATAAEALAASIS